MHSGGNTVGKFVQKCPGNYRIKPTKVKAEWPKCSFIVPFWGTNDRRTQLKYPLIRAEKQSFQYANLSFHLYLFMIAIAFAKPITVTK